MKRSFVLPTLAAALLAGSTLTHGSAVGAPVVPYQRELLH